MKEINVACAIIKNNDEILICQRNGGKFDGLWEFPGGKIENNEEPVEAIKRELNEELNLIINNPKYLTNIYYDYDNFRLNMQVFIVNVEKKLIFSNVHKKVLWINKKVIDKFELLPADYLILEKI